MGSIDWMQVIFVCIGALIVWGVWDSLQPPRRRRSEDQKRVEKWNRLVKQGLVVQEPGTDEPARWRLSRASLVHDRNVRWLISKGELVPAASGGLYYEPSLKIADPDAYADQQHHELFKSVNRRRIPKLVEQGYLRQLGDDKVQIIRTDSDFREDLAWFIGYGLLTPLPDGSYAVNYDASPTPPSVRRRPKPHPSLFAPSSASPPDVDSATPRTRYAEYLRSAGWQARRQEALARAGYRCQVCNSTSRLEVHHRTYANRGNERPEDLTVLCAACHGRFHEHGRMPAR